MLAAKLAAHLQRVPEEEQDRIENLRNPATMRAHAVRKIRASSSAAPCSSR